MNSRVPGGPVRSRTTGPSAGSTVTLYAALGEGEVPLSGRVIPMQQSGWGFGMEFVDLDAAAQQQLQTYYQQHAAN